MESVKTLERLGFGDYEARAYVALLRHGAVTGYELAKVSGIPRANVYSVLQKLEERAAVVRADSPEGARYAAIPVETLLDRMESRFRQSVEAARGELAGLSPLTEPAFVWNLSGYGPILEHARLLINAATEQLSIGIYPEEAVMLAGSMDDAEARGVELTTLCMNACAEPCAGCRGRLFRFRVLEEQQRRRLLVVTDDGEMLAAELPGGDDALAVRSRQPVLVELAGWFIRHTITLTTVLDDLGSRLAGVLGAEARHVLATIGRVEEVTSSRARGDGPESPA